MAYRALRPLTGVYGFVRRGQEFTPPDDVAEKLEERGLIERVYVPKLHNRAFVPPTPPPTPLVTPAAEAPEQPQAKPTNTKSKAK